MPVVGTSKAVNVVLVCYMVLPDLYQRLLLMDLEFALDKKVERDLWNVAFKNVIDSLQGTLSNLGKINCFCFHEA